MYRNEDGKIITEDSIISEDIGLGGLRVMFPHKLPRGKVLDLKLFLFSDPIHLPAKGKVAWSSEKQVLELSTYDNEKKSLHEIFWLGIQFIDIDSFHRERILRWIKKKFRVKEL